MISRCHPEDSPTFLHDRPDSLSFDIIFTKQPFLQGSPETKQAKDLSYLTSVIKLKAVAVNIAEGTRSEIRLTTTRIYSNSKQYQSDEFHVNVVFDISEFAKSAKEKLLHA